MDYVHVQVLDYAQRMWNLNDSHVNNINNT